MKVFSNKSEKKMIPYLELASLLVLLLKVPRTSLRKATKSLMTMNHELQYLYEPYKAWNQNLSFLVEFEKKVKEM